MNEEKRSCMGYEIIESRTIGSSEIVVGHNPNAVNPYVCWYCKNGEDYYWGYYTNELDDAQDKLRERSEYQARHLPKNHQKPPKSRDDRER